MSMLSAHQRSWFAYLLSRCNHHFSRLFVREGGTTRCEEDGAADAKLLSTPRYCYDASLLFRRMALLQIDHDELARDEPLLLRELQGFCTLCGSKAECVRDFDHEAETGEPQDWGDYCPNVAIFNALGALQNCPRAALYLKTPRALNLPR